MLDPVEFIAPRNSFAMSYRDFIPHLMGVLDQLGMSLHARTNFMKYVYYFSSLRDLRAKLATAIACRRSPRTKISPTGS